MLRWDLAGRRFRGKQDATDGYQHIFWATADPGLDCVVVLELECAAVDGYEIYDPPLQAFAPPPEPLSSATHPPYQCSR